MAKKPKDATTWRRVTEIRKKGYYIGKDSSGDCARGDREEYGLSPERAKRLVAQREA